MKLQGYNGVVKPRLLIVTTTADLSLPLFFHLSDDNLMDVSFIFYDMPIDGLESIVRKGFEFVYFRDPFNDLTISQPHAKRLTEAIIDNLRTAYKVDKISSYDDMMFEDKWHQYNLFGDLMPQTELPSSFDDVNFDTQLLKKRISARSKGIVFDRASILPKDSPQDYVLQAKLNIKKEYRVFMVGGEIVKPMAIKSSKTPNQIAKLVGLEDKIPSDLTQICQEVYKKTKFDLMGLDIVETDEGYKVLEVNRSCQFAKFYRLSGLNLASMLSSYLVQTKAD